MLKYIKQIDNFIAKIESILVFLILSTMIILSFLQIILRNLFSTSIFWGDIVLRHLVLWIGFIGASLATRDGKHINIDVLSRLLSPRLKIISQIIVNLFAAVISYFLMRAAIVFIAMEKDAESILVLGIPLWIAQIIIAVGFGIIMLRFIISAIEDSVNLFSTRKTEESS